MRLKYFQSLNAARCQRFHPIESWLPSQWSNAMAGECGEACNLTKKLDRLAMGMLHMNKPIDRDRSVLVNRIGEEVADMVIYADLLLTSLGLSLEDVVREKFNAKSIELSAPEML